MNNLAVMYINGKDIDKDPQKAMNYYRQAAEKGYPNAQFVMGNAHRLERYVEKDIAKARQYYEKSVAQEHEKAKETLANL